MRRHHLVRLILALVALAVIAVYIVTFVAHPAKKPAKVRASSAVPIASAAVA